MKEINYLVLILIVVSVCLAVLFLSSLAPPVPQRTVVSTDAGPELQKLIKEATSNVAK